MGRVVSFELNSQHPEEAIQFYSEVFGWKVAQPKWDYWPILSESEDASAIRGGIARGPSDYPHGIRITIEVDDIDAAIEKAIENGARVVRTKMEFDDFYLAYLVDPVGLVFGLTQPRNQGTS